MTQVDKKADRICGRSRSCRAITPKTLRVSLLRHTRNEMKLSSTENPFSNGDPEVLSRMLVELMPQCEASSTKETANLERTHRESSANFREARYGVLPSSTYRILDQGSLLGWFYELEVGGEEVVLREPGIRNSEYRIYSDLARVESLARSEIARRFGTQAAEEASFRVVIGGSL